jgi:hypothetical protein
MTPNQIVILVDESAALDRRIKADTARLTEILKPQLVKLSPGTYNGTDGAKALVIQPEPGIRPSASAIDSARAVAGPEAARRLFSRVIVRKAMKSFREIARNILTPAKAEKVIALCEVASNPYVILT